MFRNGFCLWLPSWDTRVTHRCAREIGVQGARELSQRQRRRQSRRGCALSSKMHLRRSVWNKIIHAMRRPIWICCFRCSHWILFPAAHLIASHWDIVRPNSCLNTGIFTYCVTVGFTPRTSKLVLKNGHLDILRHSGIYASHVQISA